MATNTDMYLELDSTAGDKGPLSKAMHSLSCGWNCISETYCQGLELVLIRTTPHNLIMATNTDMYLELDSTAGDKGPLSKAVHSLSCGWNCISETYCQGLELVLIRTTPHNLIMATNTDMYLELDSTAGDKGPLSKAVHSLSCGWNCISETYCQGLELVLIRTTPHNLIMATNTDRYLELDSTAGDKGPLSKAMHSLSCGWNCISETYCQGLELVLIRTTPHNLIMATNTDRYLELVSTAGDKGPLSKAVHSLSCGWNCICGTYSELQIGCQSLEIRTPQHNFNTAFDYG